MSKSDTRKGRINKGVGGNYHVMTQSGEFVCQARGLFRKEGVSPIVGDFVEISVVDQNKAVGYLHKILPRNNELIRPKVANVDQVVLVCAAVVPPINLDVIDGLLMHCEKQRVDAVLCINKIDLDTNSKYLEIADAYQMARYRVISVSAGQGIGLEDLRTAMSGKTSILAGPSGVGKSSILNALYPQISLEVGGLSEKIQRGKHTTRHTSLIEVEEDTYVLDSPGFTSFSIDHLDKKELQLYYREFRPYLKECYYVDCLHISEHDCAVKERVDLDIDRGRYERYTKYVTGRTNE